MIREKSGTRRPSRRMPKGSVWVASCNAWAEASIALVGMQPRRMHSPPNSPSLTISVRAPAWLAAAAAELPAEPPPRTITSKSDIGCCSS